MSDKTPHSHHKFHDQETHFEGHYQKTVVQTLKMAYRPFLARIILCVIFGFIGRLLLLSNTNVIGIWVDALTFPEKLDTRFYGHFAHYTQSDFIRLLLILAFSGFVLTYLFRVSFSRLSARAVSTLYDETTLRTSRFPMRFFDTNPAGRIMTRFSSDYGSIFRLFGGPLAEFFAIIFDLTSMCILMILASPWYIPVLIFTAAMNYVVFKLNQKNIRAQRRHLSGLRGPTIAHFAETAQGASTIRTFQKEKSFLQRFVSLDFEYNTQKVKTVKVLTLFAFQMNILTATLFAGTGLLAYWLYEHHIITVGAIGVAFGFITLSGNTIQMFFDWLSQLEDAMVGVERMDNYLHREIEAGSRLPAGRIFPTTHWVHDSAGAAPSKHKKNSAAVDVSNLWFRYSDKQDFILKGLQFHIKAGERIGIIGRTGSGKSSLIQALFYLYPITDGEIRINGVKPKLHADDSTPHTVDLSDYRKLVSYIPQDPTLFRATLRENLDLTAVVSDEEIFASLNRVGLSELANKESLQKMVEERGKNFSAGERQLLCMARCLLQNGPVVVMDEATSSVDPQSEELLVRATEYLFKDHTQIIIAHRLSTLRRCDRILWLHKGEIQKIGTPEEILPEFENFQLQL